MNAPPRALENDMFSPIMEGVFERNDNEEVQRSPKKEEVKSSYYDKT
jgi:hypothetical protein